MTTTLEAIYEKGILRLSQPIPLEEGTRVQITVTTPDSTTEASHRSGRFSWEGTPLIQDAYTGSVAEELIRQRREE